MQIKVDKSEWIRVRLCDVAVEYSKRINNPSDSELERFVGNSNIGQWDFRVKSWESTDSVTSAMKLFEPNDYLLVRRSLYASDFRERAPRAHFSGVCSGDILTIRENPEFIVDGFLILVLNSPALWKFVVANASGSITRRIKWEDLGNYEFLLPPKKQQAEIAKLLWLMNDKIEKCMVLEQRLRMSLDSIVADVCFRNNEKNHISYKLNEVIHSAISGKSIICDERQLLPQDIAILKTSAITGNDFDPMKAKVVKPENHDEVKVSVKANTILFNRKNTKSLVGSTKFITRDYKNLFIPDLIWELISNDHIVNPEFLWYLLNTPQVRVKISSLSSGTNESMVNISKKNFEKISISLPSLEVQNDFLLESNKFSRAIKDCVLNISVEKKFLKSLISQVA